MGFSLPQCNSKLEDQLITEKPVWHDWTYHHIGLWISAVFGLIAIVVSFVLIYLHANHYLKPWEQRHIIRILFMVPVYAAVSFLSFYKYTHSVYFEVIRDCYEAFAIASFFSLLCHYIATDLHQQKNYFRSITPKPWIWPIPWIQKCWGGRNGIWRTPRSGLTWFNVIWTGVFQYCFIRVTMTIVALVTQLFDRYCLETLNPAFAHVWVMGIEAVAVTIAMYCLIQFYIQVRLDIAQHKPLLKIAAIKLVIFLSFWQSLLISFLTSAGAIKASENFQAPDIRVGIPSMLLCIEMAIFSIFHLWAFSYKPYKIGSKEYAADTAPGSESADRYHGGFQGIKAIVDAMNPWDMIKAVGRAAKWLFKDRRTRENDSSYSVSRVNTNMDAFGPGESDFDQSGQKLSMLNTDEATAYNGRASGLSPGFKPAGYPPGHAELGEEHAKLLSSAEGFASSRPSGRADVSLYRNDNADIGVAKSGDYPNEPESWHEQDNGSACLPKYTSRQNTLEAAASAARTAYAQSQQASSREPSRNRQGEPPPRQPPQMYVEPPPSDPGRGRRGA